MTMDETPKYEVTLFTCFALVLIILGVRLHLIDIFGSATPYWDDWGLGGFLYQHLTSGCSFEDYLAPVNGHRMFFARILNVILFTLNEHQWDPIVTMAANAVIWALSGLFLLLLARKNSKLIAPYPFIFIIMLLWVFPTALVNAVWAAQSHNYFMILFVLAGCLLIGNTPWNIRWLCGVAALFAACLTMGGGVFASMAVATVYTTKSVFEKSNRNYLPTLAAAGIIAAIGLFLFFIQEPAGNRFATKNMTDFVITLCKTLSWPLSNSIWPCAVFFAPVVLLAFASLTAPEEKSERLTSFILSLACFVIILAIAIAYARGAGGNGPYRRYFEFLSLSLLCSWLAFLVLQRKHYQGFARFNKALLLLWLIFLLAAMPTLFGIFQLTGKERLHINAASEEIARQYILTKDENTFKNRRYLNLPFPNHQRLARWLDAFTKADILPMELQVPLLNTGITENAFTRNGTIIDQPGVTYRGEDVIGSFNKTMGSQHAKGTYKTEDFDSKRSYLVIPTLGFLGRDGLSLKLVDSSTGKETAIGAEARPSSFARTWLLNYIKTPPGPYHLEATDISDSKWFAFAAPRDMGRLSYITRKIVGKGNYIWQLGVVLLFFSFRRHIVKMLHSPEQDYHS